jgi:predicted DNA-binding transcriptional regulator AlpA
MRSVTRIGTPAEYEAALVLIDALMGANPGSPEEDKLALLADLVDEYEARPMTTTDPRYLTLSQVCELTGEDAKTLMRWMDQRVFPTPELDSPEDLDEDDDTSYWLRSRVEQWMRER